MRSLSCLLLLVLCALAPLTALRAQDPPIEEKPIAWPKLEGPAAAKLHRVQQALPKLPADDEQGFEALRAEIATIGAAAAPRLLKDLAKAGEKPEENEHWIARLRALLDLTATDAQLVPLLARELDAASAEVRFWSAERLLAWADPRSLPAARARYEKEKEARVRNTLLLLRCTLGDAESLPELEKLLQKEWARWREPAHRAMQGLRSKALSDAMLVRLQSSTEETERIFALRVLTSVGDKSAIGSISTYLDADSRALREAAVNALRAIVDHQEPRYEVSVFDLVQLVEEWKKRLPTLKR
ncbi:MAG: hypothetical protein JNM84_15025 [Planctomycetes bacterium]|nr:hypothetical protein [Planctomycetota bacterium]